LSKDTSLRKLHEDAIIFVRDMSEIVEICPVSQCWRIRKKNSYIHMQMHATSEI